MINEKAPHFSARAFCGDRIREIDLSDYYGKWTVLFFYPADFTFVCPTELRAISQDYYKFREMDVEILSISTDTEFVHRAWHDSSEMLKEIKFPMVADPSGKICRAYKTYIPEEGLSLRATFIIDPDGRIKSWEMNDNSVGRNINELLRKIKALKFVREKKNELCPANWEPDKETIKLNR